MLWLTFTLMLASSGKDDAPQALRVTTTAVIERVVLPRTRGLAEITLDALAARIELRLPRDAGAAALAARLSANSGSICPRVTARANVVELRCRSRRIDALLTTEKGRQFLEIHELRGLPWREGINGPPASHYEPFRSGLGNGCPSDSAVGRGECALRDGDRLLAATSFRDGLETRHRQFATVRLGDIALSTGDPATALGWYYRAGTLGVFGRVARARICELEGDCLGSTQLVKRAFESSGLPEPIRADMNLRAIRAEAFQGRFTSAMTMMRDIVRRDGLAGVCRNGGEMTCRRLILEAMRFQMSVPSVDPRLQLATKLAARNLPTPAEADAVAHDEQLAEEKEASQLAETTLEMYMGLPGWERGPLAMELALAAADLAGHVGAPVFAGNLLSIVAPHVPPAGMTDHLLRAAELYLQGRELARARVVIEYLSTRFTKKGQLDPRWRSVQRSLAEQLAEEDQPSADVAGAEEIVDIAKVSQEVSAAAAAGERSRSMISKLEAAASRDQREKK